MIVSGFGYRRDPWTGRRAFHSGVDLGARRGAVVRAFRGGVVRSVSRHRAAGLTVQVETQDGARHVYAHLHTATVRPGQRCEEGAALGTVGTSGRSTGPHLHYGIYLRGRWTDPTRFVAQRRHLFPQ